MKFSGRTTLKSNPETVIITLTLKLTLTLTLNPTLILILTLFSSQAGFVERLLTLTLKPDPNRDPTQKPWA